MTDPMPVLAPTAAGGDGPASSGAVVAGALASRPGRGAMLTVFVVALALRLLYLWQIADMPFVETPIIDARAYDAWAQRIAGGDWWGSETFYQAPLYPYLLACVYTVFGHDLMIVHVLQMAVGALACVLALRLGTALFGPATGLVAGLGLALYPPALYFDGIIGKAGLGLVLLLALLVQAVAFQLDRRLGRLVLAGALLGALALTRENALALLPAFWVWLVFERDRGGEGAPRARARALAAFTAGVAIVLVPVATRNWIVGDTFAPTTSQLGPNFWIGNNPNATGLYAPLIPGRQTPDFEAPDAELLAEQALGRELTRGEVSDYWLGRGLEFVRDEPGRFAELLAYKALLTWGWLEIPDAEDIYVYAEWSWLLSGLLAVYDFGVLAPLSLAGLVLAWPRRRVLWLLPWLAVVYTASVCLFMTFARFRFPLVPLLLPFAAFAVVEAVRRIRAGEGAGLVVPALAALAAFAWLRIDWIESEPLQTSAWMNLGGRMLAERDYARAETFIERAHALSPASGDVLFHLGVLRQAQGRLDEAEAALLEMARVSPDDYRAWRVLAQVYRAKDQPAKALAAGRRAFALNPDPDKQGRRVPIRSGSIDSQSVESPGPQAR